LRGKCLCHHPVQVFKLDLKDSRMVLKRHEILEKKLHATLEYTLSSIAESESENLERTAPGKPAQQFAREWEIRTPVRCAVLEHLGYGPIENLVGRLNRGVDRAVEYYFGDWWRGDEYDSKCLDKSRADRELRWFDVLPHALLLGGLTGRWNDVAKICSWFDASIEMEYQAGMLEDAYMQLFLCIASSLSPTPMPGVEAILANVKACRTKRPRLLCAVWEAALAKDQKAFNKALKDSVSHFLKSDAEDVPNVTFWVALHPSFIWLLAERNGLAFPELPEQIDAAIVRRQTIGLA
jgi:hypothetical protein